MRVKDYKIMERITITINIKTLTKLDKIAKSIDRSSRSDTISQIIKEYNLNE